MDFFEAQARAKQRTTRLVFLFALAVLGIILASYLATVVGLARLPNTRLRRNSGFVDYQSAAAPVELWQPGLFFAVTAVTLTVIGLASLYKWREFAGGGSAVAESVGARRVDPRTTELRERQLLNVVEEMALAAGLPTPAVYVLDDEPGINAFAAGHTTSDAVVCVTRGTLQKLTRDELQGVVGHEFSHILNGDMRLNLRLTAIVFGILVLGLTGRGILESLRNVRLRGKNSGGILALIVVSGLFLLILGYVGYFFGKLIQAAISRQREFLADAAAVQFTRNPGGISGALKKIGGYALGSTMIAHNTAQINHFFFGQAFRSVFDGIWATHPPLDERLLAIDPRFDGKMFTPPEVVDVARENFLHAGFAPTNRIAFRPRDVVASVGTLTEAHFRQAQNLLAALPDPLRAAARDSAQAPALICGLLLDADATIRDRQLALVAENAGPATAAALTPLLPALATVAEEARLSLLQLALPVLRFLEPGSLDRFLTALDALVHADGVVTPFEFALQKILARQLHLTRRPSTAMGDIQSFAAVANDIAVVLSTLARADQRDEATASTAFAVGASQLRFVETPLALLPPAASNLTALDAALDKLALASPIIKQRLLIAAAQTIGADNAITVAEANLFRALAAALDLPLPLPTAA